MQLCIFEDTNCSLLEPLTFYRPVYDLCCGMNTLRDKILNAYPDTKHALHCRQYLEDFVKSNNPKIRINQIDDIECLFINGRILAPQNLMDIIPLRGEDKLYKDGNMVIAARMSGKNLGNIKSKLTNLLSIADFDCLQVETIEIPVIKYIWDLIYNNGKELINDCKFDVKNNLKGKIYDGVHLVEKDNVYIAEDTAVKPGVVLDASKGPVYIDRNVKVFPNAVIEGPVYIGANSQIKSGATIYENVSIGETCKIGGEVEDTLFLPFSNKQHSGFIGHAYVGSWVNIGADTNCSDLKNNYGSVKVFVSGKEVNTNVQFLGIIMGDHSKTAINTMFNTGTTVGFSCNIFGAGFPEKYIPSFSWGGSDSMAAYDVEKSIETAKKVLKEEIKK